MKTKDELVDAACTAVMDALGDAYDCGRVWEAWSYGTMGPDDFDLVAEDPDRVTEIAVAATRPFIAAMDAIERDQQRLRDALVDAVAHLAGAASAYEKYALRHTGIQPRATVDALYSTRVKDFRRAVARGRNTLAAQKSAEAGTIHDPDWIPTPENINRLPEPVRRYIHDLATNADPAGMVAENTLLRDQTRMLDAMIGRLKRELAQAQYGG